MANAALDVPEVPEFFEQIVTSGGHPWACRMSADMNHLTKDDLYDEVEDIISASDFIEKTVGTQMLFIQSSPFSSSGRAGRRRHEAALCDLPLRPSGPLALTGKDSAS